MLEPDVLQQIATKGRDGFYAGDVCADMVDTLRSLGGVHTEEDFKNAQANYTNPSSGSYGKCELIEHPPNGQGATAILMANMLKNFDISSRHHKQSLYQLLNFWPHLKAQYLLEKFLFVLKD